MAQPQDSWKNRIVDQAEIPPKELLAHPCNWRIHPASQRAALATVLAEIGWVQRVLVNRTTGRLVDGHLRVLLAQERGEPTVPVLFVELSEAEEKAVLATFDPIAGLAEPDAQKLDRLLCDIDSQNPAIRQLLADLAPLADSPGSDAQAMPANDQTDELGCTFQILIDCQSEQQQAELLQRFEREGLVCRAMIG